MDTQDHSALSEVESLSDSDWLDISSRTSEDGDFVDSDISDREDLSSDNRSPSRQSLSSFSSSHEGRIHGWEGIVEDGVDGALVSPSPPSVDVPAAGYAQETLRLSHQSLSFRMAALSEAAVAQHTAQEDPEEEQRVKDGLDQSMMSTLSASRSNSLNASVQTSIVHSRDLRLSFPDPLTSSSPHAQSLSPSYEDISAPSAAELMSDKDAQAITDAEAVPQGSLARFTDVDPDTTLPAAAQDAIGARTEIPSSSVIDFYIVLYGASSALKHRVVRRVLEKLMEATHCGFSSLPQIDVPQDIRMLLGGGRTSHCIISVVDRTQPALLAKEPSPFIVLDRPSLAIIFLPSRNLLVPEHTLYLPVLDQSDSDTDEDAFTPIDRLLEAEYQWETMDVSPSQLVSPAFTLSKSAVIEEEEIERASPAKVSRHFRPLLPWTQQMAGYHMASRHAFTLFAILSIVLGYLVNGSLPLSETQRPSATVDLARPAPAPVVNASASFSTPVTTPTGMAHISSSFKDIALAAISPYALASTSTSSVATKAVPSPTQALGKNAEQASAPSECSCGCGLITWPDKFKEATDVALRSTPSMPSVGGSTFQKDGALAFGPPAAADKGKGKARAAEDSLYALSTRLAGALTEYLDMRTIFAQTGQDLRELFDALDDLARAVERQAGSAYAQSKSTLEVVRERIRTRHERARSRAKELREVGERLFSSVSEQMRGRVVTAKENARGVRDNVRLLREEGRARRQERSERRRERKRWARRAATAE